MLKKKQYFIGFLISIILPTLACNLNLASDPTSQLPPSSPSPMEVTTEEPSTSLPKTTPTHPTPVQSSASTTEELPERSRPTRTPIQISPTPVANIDILLSSCPTQAEMERFKSDFDILFDTDNDIPEYVCQNGTGPDGNVNPRLALYQGLRAIHSLQFDPSLPWTDQTLYDWLKSTINGVILTETDLSYCCDAENRIVLKATLLNQSDYRFWVNPQSGSGLIGFVGLIVHEARHAEIGGHTCGSDDKTLEELGAWGTQYYLFKYIADNTPQEFFTDLQRQTAINHANTALTRICNP